MEITYDKDADALYIEFSYAEFVKNEILERARDVTKSRHAKNKKIDSKTIIDIDKNDQIIGIELLDVSHRIPRNFLQKVKVNNIELE